MVIDLHKVVGDRIIESDTGKEVMWRGAGGSYLFHKPSDYQGAWNRHLADMQYMGFNTFRLAFGFADSEPYYKCSLGGNYTTQTACEAAGGTWINTGATSADVLDFTKLDWLLSLLDSYGMKAILDLHNYGDMAEDFGSQKIIADWTYLANRYLGDDRIAAFEVFNEPYNGSGTWAPWITTTQHVFQAYKQLTDAIHNIDPDRIVIWESGWYLPANLWDYKNQVPDNVVFTHHEWWTNDNEEITQYGAVELSKRVLSYPVSMRKLLNRPFWLGEFGTDNGGNHFPFDPANLEDQICEQLLYRCEEQVEGWNLWQGSNLDSYLMHPKEIFPLKIYNANLIRQPFVFPAPNLFDHMVAWNHVDKATPSRIDMWHNNDSVTLSPGIIIKIVNSRVTPNPTTIEETITLTEQTTITNPVVSGEDWNTVIVPVSYTKKYIFSQWQDGDTNPSKTVVV